jgi:hypothetical protein
MLTFNSISGLRDKITQANLCFGSVALVAPMSHTIKFVVSTTSGTVEGRFMTDPAKLSSFNLCMWLREFIKESQVMDPRFRIMPIEGE